MLKTYHAPSRSQYKNFCLGQITVDGKSNEIPAVQELLDVLNLKGAVVTADAMHCQKKTAKKIIEKEADYILQVKGNQKGLFETIIDEFERHAETNYSDRHVRQSSTRERNRQRKETRTCMVAPAPTLLKEKWPGLKTIGLILRKRENHDGTESEEIF
jgi:predicted transposase YbfD/YdcC